MDPPARAGAPSRWAARALRPGWRGGRPSPEHRDGQAGTPGHRDLRGALERPDDPGRQEGFGNRHRRPVRLPLVPERRGQVSPGPRRGARRVLLPAGLRPGDTVRLPGPGGQGPRQPGHVDARRDRRRPRRDRAVRGRPGRPEDVRLHAHQQQDRCRAGRAAVPPPDGAAARLFPVPTSRRQRRPRARTGEHPPVPDRVGTDPGDGPPLHRCLPGRDGDVLARPDRPRARLVALLRAGQRGRDADLPHPPRRAVPPRR